MVCTSTDSSDNTATSNFTVTVLDNIAPVRWSRFRRTRRAGDERRGRGVHVQRQRERQRRRVADASLHAAKRLDVPIGTTTVTCTATDAANNTGTASFTVTVVDTIAPVLTVPANIAVVMSVSATTASVTYSASATDLGQPVSVTCTSVAGTVTTFPVTQQFPVGNDNGDLHGE